MRKLGIGGVVVSLGYLALLGIVFVGDLSEIRSLQLNALGDFLAGVFSPLAFLWLVIGFFQQGAELRNSSTALQLQADELKASVAQQSQIAQTTKEQFALQQEEFAKTLEQLSEAKRPRFFVSYQGHNRRRNGAAGERMHEFVFVNIGAIATDVDILFLYGDQKNFGEIPAVVWPQFDRQRVGLYLIEGDTYGDDIQMEISYGDAAGRNYRDRYIFSRTATDLGERFELLGPETSQTLQQHVRMTPQTNATS